MSKAVGVSESTVGRIWRDHFPIVLSLIGIGVYSLHYSAFDIGVVIVFGLAGYGMKRLDYPAAPLLFGFILGPMVEDHLRRALLLGQGDPAVLVGSPVSAGFLLGGLAVGVLSWGGASRIKRG
jgi:TctA family transporter